MESYIYTITANFFGNKPVIKHLTTLMKNFDELFNLVNCNSYPEEGCLDDLFDEDWLPLIFDDKTLERLDDYTIEMPEGLDHDSLAVYSEGYDLEEDGSITLFAWCRNEFGGIDLCAKMCEALGLGCKFRLADEDGENLHDEFIPAVEDPDGSLVLRPLSELDMDDNN